MQLLEYECCVFPTISSRSSFSQWEKYIDLTHPVWWWGQHIWVLGCWSDRTRRLKTLWSLQARRDRDSSYFLCGCTHPLQELLSIDCGFHAVCFLMWTRKTKLFIFLAAVPHLLFSHMSHLSFVSSVMPPIMFLYFLHERAAMKQSSGWLLLILSSECIISVCAFTVFMRVHSKFWLINSVN